MVDMMELSADAAIELDRKLQKRPFDKSIVANFFERLYVWSPNATEADLTGRNLIAVADVADALRTANMEIVSLSDLISSLDRLRSVQNSDDPAEIEALKRFCLTISRHLQLDRLARIESLHQYEGTSLPVWSN